MAGFIQGYSTCTLLIFRVVNSECGIYSAIGDTVTSVISCSYANGFLTITTANNSQSRVLVMA